MRADTRSRSALVAICKQAESERLLTRAPPAPGKQAGQTSRESCTQLDSVQPSTVKKINKFAILQPVKCT